MKKNRTSSTTSLADRLLAEPKVQQALPWLAGAGMALGHAAVSSNCTIPQQGRCSTCGSCAIVVGTLAFWALAKKQRESLPVIDSIAKEHQQEL